MVSEKSNRSLVVVELTGGNDCLNTVVPYDDELYYDYRPTVHHKQDEVLKLDGRLGLSPQMGPIKRLWDDGNVAVINGIGYPEPNRSHFRAMDIWHTAEPTKVIGEGWLGRAIRDLDPRGENVLTGPKPRPRAAQGAVVRGGAGGVRRKPRDLRAVPRHSGRAGAAGHSQHLFTDVRRGRGKGRRVRVHRTGPARPPSRERTSSGRRLRAMFRKWSMRRIRSLRGFATRPR